MMLPKTIRSNARAEDESVKSSDMFRSMSNSKPSYFSTQGQADKVPKKEYSQFETTYELDNALPLCAPTKSKKSYATEQVFQENECTVTELSQRSRHISGRSDNAKNSKSSSPLMPYEYHVDEDAVVAPETKSGRRSKAGNSPNEVGKHEICEEVKALSSNFSQLQETQARVCHPNDLPILPDIGHEVPSQPHDYSWEPAAPEGYYAYDAPYYKYWGNDHAYSSYYYYSHPPPPYRNPYQYHHSGHNSYYAYQNNVQNYQDQHHNHSRKRIHHHDDMATTPSTEQEQNSSYRKQKKKRTKRTDDMPRYPLSAYNFFFSEEREIILAMLPLAHEDKKNKNRDNAPSPVPSCDSVSDTHHEPRLQDTNNDEKNNNVDITSQDDEMMPKFDNQQEEMRYIQDFLSTRKLPKDKMEELQKKIKANSQRILGIRWEGDKVKKSHKKSHGKVTFQVLSRLIGQRWRDLPDGDEKSYYFDLAKKDMERYNQQMK